MYSGHSCKVSRAAGAVPTRLFTPLHTPVHSDFFRGNACNPSGTARRALSRPPGPLERRRRGRPHPRRRAHPGRRRPGRTRLAVCALAPPGRSTFHDADPELARFWMAGAVARRRAVAGRSAARAAGGGPLVAWVRRRAVGRWVARLWRGGTSLGRAGARCAGWLARYHHWKWLRGTLCS